MVNREAVINRLEEQISVCSLVGGGLDVVINWKLADDILALLKEQEPVKPTWSQGKAYCGNCGQKMPRKCDGIERRYCSFCGKAVKWDV